MRLPGLLPLFICCLLLSPTAKAQALAGKTVEYAYDARDLGKEERAWWGRAYLHPSVLDDTNVARPVVVYLHGVNRLQVKHAWMGAGGSPDLRMLWDEYLRDRRIAPAVLAVPSATTACILPTALWDGFDLDRFLAHTIRATRDLVRLDLSKVVVVGHSGAGCNHRGGLVTALQSSLPLVGGLVIDVCMDVLDAAPLAQARPDTDVVITYQRGWKRDFEGFGSHFLDASRRSGATGVRQVEELPVLGRNAHTIIVKESMDRWLPRWLPAR
jgi:hypothetical protein